MPRGDYFAITTRYDGLPLPITVASYTTLSEAADGLIEQTKLAWLRLDTHQLYDDNGKPLSCAAHIEVFLDKYAIDTALAHAEGRVKGNPVASNKVTYNRRGVSTLTKDEGRTRAEQNMNRDLAKRNQA